MINVFLIAPRQCWHTQDLLKLQSYGLYSYCLVYDTPPFLARSFYRKIFISRFISFELLQRFWRIAGLPMWSIYIFFRVRFSSNIIHCHGLFSLVIAISSFLPCSRIVFTPQGSDILVLPFKNIFVKKFLLYFLSKLRSITADSQLILDVCTSLSNLDTSKLFHIQNGIDFSMLKSIPESSSKFDICWPRGLSSIYQFDYFLSILLHLSSIVTFPLHVCIIGAFGNTKIPHSLLKSKNIKFTFFDRLNPLNFFSVLKASRLIVSIPKSDSSPRTVYEAIALKKQLFISDLRCFDWIPSFSNFPFMYSTGSEKDDALLINEYLQSSSNNSRNEYDIPSDFYDALNYSSVSKAFFAVYTKISL